MCVGYLSNLRWRRLLLLLSRFPLQAPLSGLRKRFAYTVADKVKLPIFDVRESVRLSTLWMLGTSQVIQDGLARENFDMISPSEVDRMVDFVKGHSEDSNQKIHSSLNEWDVFYDKPLGIDKKSP